MKKSDVSRARRGNKGRKSERSHQKDRAVFAAEGRSGEVEEEFPVDILVHRCLVSISKRLCRQNRLELTVISLSFEKSKTTSVSLDPRTNSRRTTIDPRSPEVTVGSSSVGIGSGRSSRGEDGPSCRPSLSNKGKEEKRRAGRRALVSSSRLTSTEIREEEVN